MVHLNDEMMGGRGTIEGEGGRAKAYVVEEVSMTRDEGMHTDQQSS